MSWGAVACREHGAEGSRTTHAVPGQTGRGARTAGDAGRAGQELAGEDKEPLRNKGWKTGLPSKCKWMGYRSRRAGPAELCVEDLSGERALCLCLKRSSKATSSLCVLGGDGAGGAVPGCV